MSKAASFTLQLLSQRQHNKNLQNTGPVCKSRKPQAMQWRGDGDQKR